jgi:predicted nucleic acid-binding protein
VQPLKSFSELTNENALRALTFIYDIVDEYIPISENDVEAFHESIRLEHPAYDMLYFTLARRNSATLVTCDKKLCALCKKEGVSAITGQIPM